MKETVQAVRDAVKNREVVVRKLEPMEHESTRFLYEEAFPEDSQEFVRYYYMYRAARNQIFVVENQREICSMLHLNPYQLQCAGQLCQSFYIVAVATGEQYRHKGYMSMLLHASLKEMAKKKIPFTFLMPAAREIYLPFDFRFIYWQNQGGFCAASGRETEGELEMAKAGVEHLAQLAEVADRLLGAYTVHAVHDEEYFRILLEEQKVQDGEVTLIRRDGEVVGYCFLAQEGETCEIRELVVDQSLEREAWKLLKKTYGQDHKVHVEGFAKSGYPQCIQKPKIMARLVNLQACIALLKAVEPVVIEFALEDSMVPENNGIYRLMADEYGCRLSGTESGRDVEKLEPGQLTQLIFGAECQEVSPVFLNKWKKIETLSPVFLNEVV